jgi:hypothetical protein
MTRRDQAAESTSSIPIAELGPEYRSGHSQRLAEDMHTRYDGVAAEELPAELRDLLRALNTREQRQP